MVSNITQYRLLSIFMFLFFIMGPLSTTQWNKIVVVILFSLAFITIFFCSLLSSKNRFWSLAIFPSLCYLCAFVVSLFAILLTREHLTGEFIDSVIVGRLFTFVTVLMMVYLLNVWLVASDEKQLNKALKIAFFVLLIFVLLGIWQFIGNLIGIPFFIETRDWMHGVPSAIRSLVPKRLTSISEEPNFLSPLLIEYLILIGLVIVRRSIKYTLYALGLFVALFSFSGGVYINLLLLIFLYGVLSLFRSLMKGVLNGKDIIFILSIFLFFVLIIFIGDILLDFLYYKVQGEAAGQSSRSQFLSSLMQLIADSNFSQLMFGHGMGTMGVLTSFGLPKEDFLFRITNNFYLDMLWEGGFIGLGFIIIFFMSLICFGLKGYMNNHYIEAGLLFTMHMIVTSLYRSEYLSAHFVWVLSMVLVCYRLGYIKVQRVN